ncbi:hypothetical protein C5167_019499 [Papaver somniferum]|uniref:AmmeMemoRadiSam system protein B n=1 Tax=Papaver somniferum TaxID=3469 RepID=A0A4Y7ITL7_PAPSO|nr:hypothetical protein C5167_019499 [Papaver somniferum]
MERLRKASHAGSWYTDNPAKLGAELDGWLQATGLAKSPDVRGVIAPHAGYSFSGRCAAYSFANIDPTNMLRQDTVYICELSVCVVNGVSHYEECLEYSGVSSWPISPLLHSKMALSTAIAYKTPLGDLPIDLEGM